MLELVENSREKAKNFNVSRELKEARQPIGRVFADKKGNEIKEYDVLKVFHFIGARKKKHYMYKWVRLDKYGHLAITHLDGSSEMVSLHTCSSTGRLVDAEIVQSQYP